MHIHRDINNLPKFQNAILTIGSFDGVHRGHQKIISRINNLAEAIDGESVLITFHPHPRQVIYPSDNSLELLSTIDEKIHLFKKYCIDHLVIVPFSVEFSQQNPREYLDQFIMKKFNPSYVVVGYDHRFGLNRGGDIHLLKRYADEKGFKVLEIKKQEIEDITISSTKIRNALKEGDIDHATLFLGHEYSLSGRVVHGDKIGNQLGFPTANISIFDKEKLIPQYGIYAVKAIVNGKEHGGMLYIGERPTINTRQKISLEVNIFDFHEDIYDEVIEVKMVEFIRSDEKFDNLKSLRQRLKLDKEAAVEILESKKKESAKDTLISIAILNFNGVDYLEAFLPSVVAECPENGEIVVIDNASTDESVPFLEEWYPEIRIINLAKNYGFAGGYSKGIEYIHSEYTFILNSDVKLEKGCIQELINSVSAKNIIAAQPCIISMDDPGKYEYAGAAGGMMDHLGYPFCRGRVLSEIEELNDSYAHSEIFWGSGAAILVKTQLFKNLGAFDKDYFAHQEEIDFCWRAKTAGYSIVYAPDAKVYHLGGGTLNYQNPHKTYLNFRNNIYTVIKNESGSKLLWLIPSRFFLDLLAAIHFLFGGKFKNFWAVLKAYFSIIINIRKYIVKRAFYKKLIMDSKIGNPNIVGRTPRSILWDFYVLGKRKCSEIIDSKQQSSIET